MVRFSVGGSEGEEDRDSNNSKRPISENEDSRTSTNFGYQDKDEHGSYSIRFSNNKPRPSITFTKKPRFSIPSTSPSPSPSPTAAACATTSAAPQQRCKLVEYGLFDRINNEEGDEGEGDGDGDEEPMEEMEEEAHESSDKEERTDGQLSVIISDPDVLDCPICLEPLTLPVFQVKQGIWRLGEVEGGDYNNGVGLGGRLAAEDCWRSRKILLNYQGIVVLKMTLILQS